jgi:hypothetical protein
MLYYFALGLTASLLVACLQTVGFLGTGEAGSRPGRHYFMTHDGGRHEHSAPRSGFLWSRITVREIGMLAPPPAAGAPACKKGPCTETEGARGTVHLCVFPNGTDKGGDWNPYWSLQGYAITYGGLRSLSCPATTLYETLNSTTTAHHHPNRQQTKSRKAYRNYR